jgi:hypothetical protein
MGTFGPSVDDFLDAVVPFDVWIDGDGRVRRQLLELDLAGLGIPEAPGAVQIDTRFTDFGDDIVIEIPEDATDLTGRLPALPGG